MKEGGGGVLKRGQGGTEGEKECRAVLRPFNRCGDHAMRGGGRELGGRGCGATCGRRGMGAWSRPTAARLRRARAEWSCSNTPGAPDMWAPASSARERERRGVGRMGRPGEKMEWAEPRGFLIYSNKFQLVRNVLIKRGTYQAPKFLNTIWLERV
jgi:hypothetical protein